MLLDLVKKLIPGRVKRRVKAFYYNLLYIYNSRRLIRNADTSRSVEVAVFIMIAENWNSFESVYRHILSDSRINVTVYVFPGHVFTDKPEELNLKLYGEVLSFFAERGIDVVKAYNPENDTWITPESVKADYIFYDEPYHIYPEEFSINQMYKHARVCYIPYGYMLTQSENLLRIVTPLSTFQFIYAFFASADYIADYANKLYGKIFSRYHHVLRLGFPRFDLTYKIAETTYRGGGLRLFGIPVSL